MESWQLIQQGGRGFQRQSQLGVSLQEAKWKELSQEVKLITPWDSCQGQQSDKQALVSNKSMQKGLLLLLQHVGNCIILPAQSGMLITLGAGVGNS